MTDDEIDFVAAELAKAGGVSWYPGRERGPLKLVTERYRDRARLAIAALERYRARQANSPSTGQPADMPPDPSPNVGSSSDNLPQIGTMVLYRPVGDRRAYLCRIERIEGDRAYLVPDLKACSGWADIKQLSSTSVDEEPQV